MINALRNLIVQDFWLKLFSLLLAVLTWLAVSFAQKRENSPLAPPVPMDVRTLFDLPVVVMSSAEEVQHFKVVPDRVSVTIQGEARLMQNLQNKDIHVLVDLSGIRATGELHKRIEISTPAGVTYVRVTPPEVQVLFPTKSD